MWTTSWGENFFGNQWKFGNISDFEHDLDTKAFEIWVFVHFQIIIHTLANWQFWHFQSLSNTFSIKTFMPNKFFERPVSCSKLDEVIDFSQRLAKRECKPHTWNLPPYKKERPRPSWRPFWYIVCMTKSLDGTKLPASRMLINRSYLLISYCRTMIAALSSLFLEEGGGNGK